MVESRHGGNPRADRLQGTAEMRMREYANHPGYRGRGGDVDAANAPMRPRASKQSSVQHSFQMDVIDIPAAAR